MKKIAVLLVLLLVACATQTARPSSSQEPAAAAPHEEPAMTPSEPVATPPPAAEPAVMTPNKTAPTPATRPSPPSVSSSKPVTVASAPAHTNGPLGDLSPFKTISEDTLTLVRAGKLDAAKTRVADLETAWDDAEFKLKAMNPSYWTKIDDAIDATLKQLRLHTQDPKACENALTNLISILDEVSAK